MKDLVAVFKILNVCADRIEDQALYIQPMIAILQLCAIPFLKEKSSDETAYEQICVESIAQLGECITHLEVHPCDRAILVWHAINTDRSPIGYFMGRHGSISGSVWNLQARDCRFDPWLG